jgi:hypothetical protein
LSIDVNYLIFDEMEESILDSLGEHAVAVSAISDHLRDLVISLRNTARLIWCNDQTFDEAVQDPDDASIFS